MNQLTPTPRRIEPWRPFARSGDLAHAFWFFLCVNALCLFGPGMVGAFRSPVNWLPDFFQEYASARNAISGRDIYLDHSLSMPLYLARTPNRDRIVVYVNAHPPTSVLLSLPFAALDFPTALAAWNVLSIVVLALALALIATQLRLKIGLDWLLPGLVLAVTCGPIREQIRQGQWNAILLALIVVAWVAERNGRARLAGVCLGLATTIKLFPAFLIVYFALRRRKSVVVSAVVTIVAATAITAMVLGSSAYIEYVATAMPQIGWFRVAWNNSSILGFFSKLFDPLPDHPLNFWWKTTALWTSPAVVWVGTGLVSIAVVIAWARSTLAAGDDLHDRDRTFALSCVAMIVLNPVAWEHYFLILALPLALVWSDLPGPGEGRGVKALFLAVVGHVWAGPEQVFRSLGLLGGSTASPSQVVLVLSYQFYALAALAALLSLSRARRLSIPGAIGTSRAWITATACLAIAFLAHRTYQTWSSRGLFDWIGLDYAIYASTARVVIHRGAKHFYNVDAIADQIRAFLPYYGPHADALKSGPTPYLSPFIAPFFLTDRLGPVVGFAAWTIAKVVLLVGLSRDLLRDAPERSRGAILATFAFLPVAYELFLGQIALVAVFGLFLAFRAFQRSREFSAGCWLGLLLVKPQFAALIGLILLLKGRWRALGGLAMVGVVLGVETLAMVGTRGVADFRSILAKFSGFRAVPSIVYPGDMINVRGVLVNLLPESWTDPTGASITLAVSAALCLGLIPIWSGRWEPGSRRFSIQWLATILVTLMAGYHNHIHSASLLVVPMLAVVASGPVPPVLATTAMAAVVVPTYLFCVTGVPKYSAWTLFGLMFAGYGWCVARAISSRSAVVRPRRESFAGDWPPAHSPHLKPWDAPEATISRPIPLLPEVMPCPTVEASR